VSERFMTGKSAGAMAKSRTGRSFSQPTSRTVAGFGHGPTEVFRGRLRQALSGDWVFNASTGQNGVVGFMLGSVGSNWNSSESPATGLQITITFQLAATAPNPINEVIVLTSVIPTDFAG
jgi:hypothetical protein